MFSFIKDMSSELSICWNGDSHFIYLFNFSVNAASLIHGCAVGRHTGRLSNPSPPQYFRIVIGRDSLGSSGLSHDHKLF